MANELIGNWKCISTENFDEFLKKLGVNFLVRKVGSSLKPSLKIEFDETEQKWKITSESIKTTVTIFELNKEFVQEEAQVGKFHSTAIIEGRKMIHTQRDDNGKVVFTITREVNEKCEQIVTFQINDVVARRVFVRA